MVKRISRWTWWIKQDNFSVGIPTAETPKIDISWAIFPSTVWHGKIERGKISLHHTVFHAHTYKKSIGRHLCFQRVKALASTEQVKFSTSSNFWIFHFNDICSQYIYVYEKFSQFWAADLPRCHSETFCKFKICFFLLFKTQNRLNTSLDTFPGETGGLKTLGWTSEWDRNSRIWI